jgi:ADP-ribose pyrophosphatase
MFVCLQTISLGGRAGRGGAVQVKGVELLSDERAGRGGHLLIRRMRVRMILEDGSRTKEGTWDFVERPMGVDAVVLLLFRKGPLGVEVLLRSGVRVPLLYGRPERRPLLFTELVAGILEEGDQIAQRAAEEAYEEAGIRVDPDRIKVLGPPMFPTPGMCPELFHFVSCEVDPQAAPEQPSGDGSPFEEGARLEWVSLREALSRVSRGELQDLKTEVGLRRLRDQVR